MGFGRDGRRRIAGRKEIFKTWDNADWRTNGYKLPRNGNFKSFLYQK